MRYSDSNWSQLTKPTPNSVPALQVSQYQRRNRPPAEQAHADADDDAVRDQAQHRVGEAEGRRLARSS